MSIEGNVLSNSFANAATENMYRDSLANRNDLPLTDAASVTQMQETLEANVVPESPNVPNVGPVSPASPGDEILNSIQKISDFQNNSVQILADTAKNMEKQGQVTMSGVFEMQTKLMEFQLKQELISKTTGSISQGMQTLFKNQ